MRWPSRSVEERLRAKSKFTASGCILFTGYVKRYGRIKLKGKCYAVHRVAWELVYGAIPRGMEICHTCDVPNCINVEHLFMGTHTDNMRDMQAKRRSNIGKLVAQSVQPPSKSELGESHPQAKLTRAQVLTILGKHRTGMFTQR